MHDLLAIICMLVPELVGVIGGLGRDGVGLCFSDAC